MSTELAEGCLLALGSLPGIGPASLLALHRDLGAEEAWRSILEGRTDAHRALAEAVVRLERADATAHRRGPRGAARLVAAASALDPAAVRDRHLAAGLAVLVEGSAGFPTRLVDDPAPPAVVLVQGDPELLDAPSVAIVGTRNATRLGCETARHLAAALADLGLGVVSGLALGIDGASHRALVDGPPRSGAPVGVVATGLDRSSPPATPGCRRRWRSGVRWSRRCRWAAGRPPGGSPHATASSLRSPRRW
ncbi:MAG: DNA-processing protein DprA [Acidimicrobiales bacterium]